MLIGYETDKENIDEVDELGKRPRVFDLFIDASQKPLYLGFTKFTKLTAVSIFNIQSKLKWCDTSFTMLFKALGEMHPDGNELPTSTNYAKKLVCPFSLEYQKLYACLNDCVLY